MAHPDDTAHASEGEALPFRISLAQWSLHRTIRAGELTTFDFPELTRQTFGLDAVEYVSVFMADRIAEADYLPQLRRRCDDAGVRSLLIMVDREGNLGAPDKTERMAAVANHHKWVEAASTLGCHAIRVNARSEGSYEEQMALAADGLRQLCDFGDRYNIDILVENHGGLSSNGAWLAGTIAMTSHPRAGTLPDFGNFNLGEGRTYDRYQGVAEMMPYAKAVSAKSNDFDDQGDEVHTDYRRMMKIVLEAGYHGYVGIEYEGDRHSEAEGILLTRALLERVREER